MGGHFVGPDARGAPSELAIREWTAILDEHAFEIKSGHRYKFYNILYDL